MEAEQTSFRRADAGLGVNRDVTSDRIADLELEALRRMTPTAKIAVMTGMLRLAYKLKAAGLRISHPHLSEDERQGLAREMVGQGGGVERR